MFSNAIVKQMPVRADLLGDFTFTAVKSEVDLFLKLSWIVPVFDKVSIAKISVKLDQLSPLYEFINKHLWESIQWLRVSKKCNQPLLWNHYRRSKQNRLKLFNPIQNRIPILVLGQVLPIAVIDRDLLLVKYG